MYFCSGPPRTYALADAPSDGDRVEDVALALDLQQRVVARVTGTAVSLWTSSPRARQFQAPRLLAVVPRAGRFVSAAQQARAALPPFGGVADGGSVDTQQIFAVWVTGEKLAIVERGSQYVEFYAFDGLPGYDASARDGDAGRLPELAAGDAAPLSPTSSAKIQGRFVEEYPVNQGESTRDREDVAWTMSGIVGGKYLFVGMESGLVCVVQLSTEARKIREADSVVGLWKIDVIAHLLPATPSADTDASPTQFPSCYSITAATSDPATQISSLALVACFEGGKCFIMLVTPSTRTIEQLLSLVNTERDSSSACFGRCTTATLDASGARLALGWSDGGVSLFRLALRRPPPVEKPSESTGQPAPPALDALQLQLEPVRELTMTPWGYTVRDIGGVTSLAWTQDARALAVGYELRGFAVFSPDGCRLMSSLPQHNHERPTATGSSAGGDADQVKEVCAYGTLRLAWSRDSTSLLVVARGQSFDVIMPPELVATSTGQAPTAVSAPSSTQPTSPRLQVEDLFQRVEVSILKQQDGLCLSLSGAPGRCGAWVRSDNCFTRRKDGGVGPAEASQLIEGGDLLIAINDMEDVVNMPFEHIIPLIKNLPDDTTVTLSFLRLQWKDVYPLAVRALTSRAFLEQHAIHALLDEEEEDLCIREYALRMQEKYGDCDLEERPSLLEFEKRAKFEGWEAIQGTSKTIARHKYIKLLFALFPVWNPLHILHAIIDFTAHHGLQDEYEGEQMQLSQLRRLNNSPRNRNHSLSSEFEEFPQTPAPATTRRRRISRLAFAEYDFARSVPLSDKSSKLVLVEDASIRKLSSPSLDDPCALVSAQSWSVPAEYDAKCCPLRIVAASKSGQQIAVAGQRGFCLLNLATGKWRLFGNVHEEQDMFVHALLWIHEDVVLVSFTRFREQHKVLHVVAYPRNHLDEESILAVLEFPRDSLHSSELATSFGGDNYAMVAMEIDESDENVFCLLRRELWCIGVECTGSIGKLSDDLKLSVAVKRQVRLPSSVVDSAPSSSSFSIRGCGLVDFTVIPRALHVQGRESGIRSKSLDDDSEGGGWFSSLVNMIAGGEVPDQYKPEEVLPRFAFLNADGDVIVWDPENRSQRLLSSNVTTMTRLFVNHEACESWPTPCRLMYGLYGPDGMRLWLPLLDGVYMSHTKAFEDDTTRLETFLACHDPLRAKTYEIEFGTAPATAELYEYVVREYGIELEAFVAASSLRKQQLDEGIRNLRGCITTVDDPASKDLMLRFDSDVTLLGMQHAFGLLVGVSQDVYMPPGALTVPCYDVFSRVQPFLHGVLCLLVQNEQLSWASGVVAALRRNHFALSSPTQELFLHAMLEACFSKQISAAKFQQAIKLLQPSLGADSGDTGNSGDMDEYCEIVAHVARKSEPSRLKLLFPAAGDPLELLAVCRQRGELRTAANFLLILEECSTSVDGEEQELTPASNLAFRSACAAELIAQCMEQDEWALAKHVVRVAREWVDSDHHPQSCFVDEQLGKFCWQDLVSGRFERVVKCVVELQAELPQTQGIDIGAAEKEREEIAMRLRETFVQTEKLQDLSVLLEAVERAKYEQWTLLVQRVLAETSDPAQE